MQACAHAFASLVGPAESDFVGMIGVFEDGRGRDTAAHEPSSRAPALKARGAGDGL